MNFSYLILLFSLMFLFLLSSCGNKSNSIETDKIENNYNLENELKKVGFTGDKLKKIIRNEKEIKNRFSNLTGDLKKEYIFKKNILPSLIERKFTPEFCKTKSFDSYLNCISVRNVPINEVLNYIPKEYKGFFKRKFYIRKFTYDKSLIVSEKNSDPDIIYAKKYVIKEMYNNGNITNINVCNKLKEKNLISYCKGLFK